jgi:hypothetical protein
MKLRLLGLGFVVLLLTAAAWALLWRHSTPVPAPDPVDQPQPGIPWFEEVAERRGIRFQHFDSATPKHYIQETMGSGLGWIDFDADGWLDLFVVQSGPVDPASHAGPLPTCKLYRNNGDGTFTDATDKVGLTRPGFGMGCAVGDFDNDGFDDLLVTYVGGIVLYHNQSDGNGGRHFVDVTEKAGLRNPHWATSAAWGDIDGDGYLDLYVCNYVELNGKTDPVCEHAGTKIAIQCSPTAYPKVAHKLFRNNGDGTFTDISIASGVAAATPAPGLGVVMADFDGDGRLDIFVANDMHPAYLFHNQGNGKFIERALSSGCAFDRNGTPLAGMGVAAADVDDSGRPSLFITNYQNEPNILFLNRGGLDFVDRSYPSGLGFPSLTRLGFGTAFLDADLDGVLDVAVANGHVQRPAQRLFGVPYAQEPQLFLGQSGARFHDASTKCGPFFRQRLVGRGLAVGDFDNDGRPDLALSHNAGPVALLHNADATRNHWVRLELIGDGKKSNRNAVGARVEVEAAGRKQTHFVCGGGSYLSANDRRITVGLGTAERIDRLVVVWPDGGRQEFRDLAVDRGLRFRQGQQPPELRP